MDPARTYHRVSNHCCSWLISYILHSTQHPLRPTITALIARLVHHAHYTTAFETYYLDLTTSFYTAESTHQAESLTAEKFLVHCQARRDEEMERAKAVMPEKSWEGVMDKTDRALLGGRLEWLVKDGAYFVRVGLGVRCH